MSIRNTIIAELTANFTPSQIVTINTDIQSEVVLIVVLTLFLFDGLQGQLGIFIHKSYTQDVLTAGDLEVGVVWTWPLRLREDAIDKVLVFALFHYFDY